MNYPIIQKATGTADRSRFFITIGAKNKKDWRFRVGGLLTCVCP